ncbi:MAG: winged helix-turn-helix domain-containing protein [Candidatus Rokubacteria bacterium]|nr:winged helix-turn-helix domain-containing protein [Candidatus Rokubacteria bacterium]
MPGHRPRARRPDLGAEPARGRRGLPVHAADHGHAARGHRAGWLSPDIDGLQVIARLREWSTVPIIVLSARGQEPDKVAALDAGADDYLSKPFGVGELMARMRVALRHGARGERDAPDAVFTLGDLVVDQGRRRVSVDAAEVHLTPIEYRLLATLVRHAGKVMTHRQLLQEVWGPNATEHAHYLRVYMAHLRRKLEADSAQPRYLLTEPGVGYRLADE